MQFFHQFFNLSRFPISFSIALRAHLSVLFVYSLSIGNWRKSWALIIPSKKMTTLRSSLNHALFHNAWQQKGYILCQCSLMSSTIQHLHLIVMAIRNSKCIHPPPTQSIALHVFKPSIWRNFVSACRTFILTESVQALIKSVNSNSKTLMLSYNYITFSKPLLDAISVRNLVPWVLQKNMFDRND